MAKAMGMIETRGLIGSIEAADAMVKAANVEILKQEMIDGGIVTILIEGDVGAVQAAVDAGKNAASRVGELLAAHVIPRPDEQVAKFFEKPVTPQPVVKKTSPKASVKKQGEE